MRETTKSFHVGTRVTMTLKTFSETSWPCEMIFHESWGWSYRLNESRELEPEGGAWFPFIITIGCLHVNAATTTTTSTHYVSNFVALTTMDKVGHRTDAAFTCLTTSQRILLRTLILENSCVDVQVLIKIQHNSRMWNKVFFFFWHCASRKIFTDFLLLSLSRLTTSTFLMSRLNTTKVVYVCTAPTCKQDKVQFEAKKNFKKLFCFQLFHEKMFSRKESAPSRIRKCVTPRRRVFSLWMVNGNGL